MNNIRIKYCFIAVFVFIAAALSAQISIIAHRGASAYEAENSLAAFKKAFQLNADAIELDIWRTTDDSLVVIHDRTTARVSNGNLVVPESSSFELRKLKLKNGESIPFLQEVISVLPKGKKIVIEIKCGDEKEKAGDVFPMLKNVLQRTGRIEDAIIISFNLEALAEAKRQLPNNNCYYLTGQKDKENDLIETCLKFKLDGLNIHYGLLTESLAEKTRNAGLDLLVWTVDKPEVALNARLKNKVMAITTNKPDAMREIMDKNNYESVYYAQKKSLYEMLPDTADEIIFLGNSITDMGEWSEFFQNRKVKNRGISGDITLGVLARLDEVLASKPDKIFLMIGINDIAGNNPDSIILWNYKQIIEQIQIKSTDTQLYVQSILPTNSSFTQYHRHQGKTDHILFLNQKLKELSAQQNLTYIDAFAALADAGNQLKPEYTNDGLHLMAEGYKVWIDLLKPFVNEAKCARKK